MDTQSQDTQGSEQTQGPEQTQSDLEVQVVEVLKTIYDPEIPVNIYDLGLIYEVQARDSEVFVRMTLTSPNCPVAEILPKQVETAVRSIPDVTDAVVQLTFDPPFTMDMMSDEAKLELGFL